VSDGEFRWPDDPPAKLEDGLGPVDVIEALYAPVSLRLDNRVPPGAPTLLAICAPTEVQRLIIVVCLRDEPDEPWTIVGVRDARTHKRPMWRKHTS
jgi:hypothetical protein